MELEGSLPCSQEPATGAYPEESNRHLPILLNTQFNIILHCTPRSPKWSLSFWFSYQNFVYILSVPCVLHATPMSTKYLILLLCRLSPPASACSQCTRHLSLAICRPTHPPYVTLLRSRRAWQITVSRHCFICGSSWEVSKDCIQGPYASFFMFSLVVGFPSSSSS
jgi:hypothetical protein